MSSASSNPGWLRRTLGGSNARVTWVDGVGLLLIAFFIVIARTFRRELADVVLLGIWVLVGLIGLALTRRIWLELFGPVLFYDMLRSGRRGRTVWVRVVYAGILLFV